MGFSLGSFLLPVFQGLIATAIFESGKAGVAFLANKRAIEKRYKNAFERSISRFYADPKYAGNEARKNYEHYLEALKSDFKKKEDFKPENGQYRELLTIFMEEVCKDKKLWCWSICRMLRTSVTALEEISKGQQKIIDELVKTREESQKQLSNIGGKLDTLIKSVNNLPSLQQVVIIPSEHTVIGNVDAEQIHIAKRPELTDRCIEICNTGKVLVLYGGVKIGKRTLAELVVGNLKDGFICKDVSDANLENVIRICQQELKEGKHPVITTQAPLDLNISLVDTTQLEQLEVPLLSEDETRELINTYLPRADYGKFIWAHSYGHPVLVRALCAYLTSCNWMVDESAFGKMLSFSFDHQLSRSLADLMQKMIPDAENRSLLNRIMLIKSVFTEDDVIALASIEPVISEPRTRLLTLQSGWITEKDGAYKVTPLYDKAWTPDMSKECYRACNWMLASRVLLKTGALNELDVLHYIIYAQNADRYDEAALMYIRAIEKLNKDDLDKLTLLPSMWVDVPLPKQMNEHLRIVIRNQQLLTFSQLSDAKRKYILRDLCQIVDGIKENEYTAMYYSMLSVLCWNEDQIQLGLQYFNLSRAKSIENNRGGDEMMEMEELVKKSIWFLPMRFKTVEEFSAWLKTFSSKPFEYDHSDAQMCEHCYLSAYQLVNFVWKDRIDEEMQSDLHKIFGDSVANNCPEMAISILFEMMEIYNKAGRFAETRKLYEQYYYKFKDYPLANVILNGSMAYSIYSDKECHNPDAIIYIDHLLESGNGEIIPNIQLHMRQIKAYILSEANVKDGIRELKDAIAYVQQPEHSRTPYEYYQSLGELSYMYWRVGEREKAAEMLSECITYVTSDVGLESPFAKTYLCLCDCLLINYDCELTGKELSPEQGKPYQGMFTERDAQFLDDLYTVDRIFTSSYLMYKISDSLGIERLKREWAYRVLDAIKSRGESKEIHFIATLMIPVFLKGNDFDAVAYIAEVSSAAQTKTFETHPEMKRESADSEFIEYVIVPALFSALRLAITGDRSGIDKVYHIIQTYKPVVTDEVLKQVLTVFERDTYDRQYIDEVHKLDVNKYYPVYICSYLITTLSVNAYEAFKLIMAIIVRLEGDLIKVVGPDVKALINDYISSFWRARILTVPEEFKDYKFLVNKGMKSIEEYNGKSNQANHTMYVVRYHLPQDVKLNELQEKWLEE